VWRLLLLFAGGVKRMVEVAMVIDELGGLDPCHGGVLWGNRLPEGNGRGDVVLLMVIQA